MYLKKQDQNVRGGWENAFWSRCQKATCGAILHMGGYKKVNKMTFTVIIKHQRVTCLGMHDQPKPQGSLFWKEMIDDFCKCS